MVKVRNIYGKLSLWLLLNKKFPEHNFVIIQSNKVSIVVDCLDKTIINESNWKTLDCRNSYLSS